MQKSLFAFCMVLTVSFANAQPFTLDQSFGNNGYVSTGFGFNLNVQGSSTRHIALTPDGSFYIPLQTSSEMFVVRHLANGAPDITYGNNGYSVPVNVFNSKVALQPDGKVVVAGYTYAENSYNALLARFTTSGSLDSSFGGDGIVITNIATVQGVPSSDFPNALTLQADGKIAVAGSTGASFSSEDFFVVRYLTDGSPDSSFAGDGITTMDMGSSYDVAYAIAVKSDGQIVVAGEVTIGNASRLAVACLNSDGSPNAGFSYDGKEILYWGAGSMARGVAIQPDGKIVLAGSVVVSSASFSEFLVVRMNADGTLDNNFSADGIQTMQFGPMVEIAEAVALSADGKIVVAGTAYEQTGGDFALARFNTNGTPDSSFGSHGKVTVAVSSGFDYSYSVAIDPTGKILSAGSSNTKYAVTRHTVNGSLDNSFDGDGIVTGFKPDSPASFYVAAVQTDGKIVAAGSAFARAWWTENHEEELAVIRFNVNGTIDNSFAENGRLVVDYGTGSGIATAIAIQPDGKIVVGGYVHNGRNQDFAIVRLNTDGTLDGSFGDGGKLLIDFSDSDDQLQGIAIQPDGKIVAAGRTYDWRNQQGMNFALCSYNADGTPDLSFSGDGKVITDFSTAQLPATHDEINALVLQPDGRIVVAGLHAWWTSPVDFIVARYNTDGTLDPAFNGTGFITTNIGSVDLVQSAVLQPDGKIVVSGYGYGTDGNTAIVRYNTNGTLDSSFNGYGILKSTLSEPRSMVLQDDGKIIIGGGMLNSVGETTIILMRYNIDGTPDASFASDGTLEVNLPDIYEWMEHMVLHGNRLYIAGRAASQGKGFVAALEMDLAPLFTARDFVDTRTSLMDAMAKGRLNAKEKHALNVYPNPSNTQFTIIPRMSVATTATLMVFDGSGKLVERKQIMAGHPVRLGSKYKPGIYFVECIQGNTRVRTKLVKS